MNKEELKTVLLDQLANFGVVDVQGIENGKLRMVIAGSSQSKQEALMCLNEAYAKKGVCFELKSGKTPFVIEDDNPLEIQVVVPLVDKCQNNVRFEFKRISNDIPIKGIHITSDSLDWKNVGLEKQPACFYHENNDTVNYYFNAYALTIIQKELSTNWRIPSLEEFQSFNTFEIAEIRRLITPGYSVERFGTIQSNGFFNYIWLSQTQGMKHQLYGISVFGMPKMHYKHAEKSIGLPLLIIKNTSYE